MSPTKHNHQFIYETYQVTEMFVDADGNTTKSKDYSVRYLCDDCRFHYRANWLTSEQPTIESGWSAE